MVNDTTGEAKVIDPEFCVYGPPGLDVGSLLSGMVLAGIYHKYSKTDGAVELISQRILQIWESYTTTMKGNGISDESITRIGEDAVGFACCEVARTALGFAGDRVWLKFEDPAVADAAEQTALSVAKNAMLGRKGPGVAIFATELGGL